MSTQNPTFTKAYNIISATSSWEAIAESGVLLSAVKIRIIDTGVDVTHPEFAGALVGSQLIGAVDFGSSPAGSKIDSSGHGTKVAGIIGANNLSGFGVALATNSPQMNGVLAGLPISTPYSLDIQPSGFLDAFGQLTKIFGASQDIDVVNISEGISKPVHSNPFLALFLITRWNVYGGIYTQTFNNFSDMLFVVAAGNDDQNANQMIPANAGFLDNVITVGATDNNDQRADFGFLEPGKQSNFGFLVSLAAPGVRVYAPIPGGGYDPDSSGTSFAAPMVTGVAGLLKAVQPLLTPREIKQILIRTADPITTTMVGEATKTLGSADCVSESLPLGFRGCRLNALAAVCDPLVLGAVPGCPNFTQPSPPVIHAGGSIIVRDGNVSEGEMKANASIEFDDNNFHRGDVVTDFLISSGSNTRIEGNVGYNFFVLDFPGTPITIIGTTTTPTPPPNVILPIIPPFPTGTTTLATIASDTTLPPGNHGNVVVTNGATLTLLDGVYNFDTLLFFNPDTSLFFNPETIVNVNDFFLASANVRILPTAGGSSARLPITARELITFTFGNTISADLLGGGQVILVEENATRGSIRGGILLILDNNRINAPALPPLSALTTTNRTYPTSTTPPLETLQWMEENIMSARLRNNMATSTRLEIGHSFEDAKWTLENNQ
ncbi:MAG: S8 family serine peptidase [bacterium]|nr:S8 family serine peptidase [bacterium]